MRSSFVAFILMAAVALAANNCGASESSCSNSSKNSYKTASVFGGFMGSTPTSFTSISSNFSGNDCMSGNLVYETYASMSLTQSSEADANGYITYTVNSCSPSIYFKTTDRDALKNIGFLYSCDCKAGSTCDLTKNKCYLLNNEFNYGKLVCSMGDLISGSSMKLKFTDDKICMENDNNCVDRTSGSGCIIPIWSIVLIVIVCVVLVVVIVLYVIKKVGGKKSKKIVGKK